tara:strand:- start:213 stop:515 length:303 start_codon:yes stop_codon:yes gene_type:complete
MPESETQTPQPPQPREQKDLETSPPSSQVGFFQEDSGNKSSIRLMSFVALLASIIFALITMLHKDAGVEGIYIVFGFLLAAFAPKALQKFAETKIPPLKR